MSDAELYASENTGLPASWRSRFVSVLAMLIALALAAGVLAYWGWRWFGPTPVTLPPERVEGDAARRITDAHLFGAPAPASSAADASVVIGDLRLLGVFAERDARGYALFRAGSRGAIFVAVGSEIVPGMRLEAVRPDGVTLAQGGVRRDLALRPAGPAEKAGSGPGTRTTLAQANRSPQCAPPTGFSGAILRLNAELLTGMIAAPNTWKSLLQPAAGGLVVRDQSGFAGMMGLRNGDHVERANGIALALPEDIAATVLQPLTRSQPVWVSGTRDGKPQQWLYLNAGACPA